MNAVLNEENAESLARLALKDFGIDRNAPLTFVKLRENCVFRVETPEGALALRLHRPGYRSHEEVLAESQYISALSERGLPVVLPVKTTSGDFMTVVEHDDIRTCVDVQRWVPNARQFGSSEGSSDASGLSREDFHAMGVLAARMHDIAEELAGNVTFARVPWDAKGLYGVDALWGDPRRALGLEADEIVSLERAIAVIDAELTRHGRTPAVYGTIHADFTPENVLRGDDGLVIIDFDDFGDGWYLFDLATALFFYLEDPDYESLRAGLLDGYRTLRDFDAEAERLLEVFLTVRGLTYLGWSSTRSETDTATFISESIRPLVVDRARRLVAASGGLELAVTV